MDVNKFNKYWEQFTKNADPGNLESIVEKLLSDCKAAGLEASDAESAYYASAVKKEQKVIKQIVVLKKQLSNLQAEIDAYKYPFTTATANGDDEELDNIRSAMKSLAADKAQVESEIEMLQDAFIRGDDALYSDTVAKNDLFLTLKKATQEVMKTVANCGYSKRYESIEHLCKLCASDYTIGATAGTGADMERLDKHYNAEQHAARRRDTEQEADHQQSDYEVKVTYGPGHLHEKPAPGYSPEFYKDLRDRSENAEASADSSDFESPPWYKNIASRLGNRVK